MVADAGRGSAASDDTGYPSNSDVSTSDEIAQDATSDASPASGGNGGYWTLVHSKDSQYPLAEEWTYDDASRLVKARVINLRRDVDPYYAVDITITYDGDHVSSVHDRVPEELVDLTYEYELQSGRVVAYTEAAAGEVNDSRTFDYDAEGRLVGGHEDYYGDESTWVLQRRQNGEPSQLSKNGEVACVYSWRHVWLGTTCYTGGVVSQSYEADPSERLSRLTFDGVNTVDYTYDEAGRLTSQTNGSSVFSYRYAADAKLLEARSPGYEEVRSYDDKGLLRQVRGTDGSTTYSTDFTYERVSANEVIETETSAQRTVVRTYQRLAHPPTGEPLLPSYWTILRMDQPTVYMAPVDYSVVP